MTLTTITTLSIRFYEAKHTQPIITRQFISVFLSPPIWPTLYHKAFKLVCKYFERCLGRLSFNCLPFFKHVGYVTQRYAHNYDTFLFSCQVCIYMFLRLNAVSCDHFKQAKFFDLSLQVTYLLLKMS